MTAGKRLQVVDLGRRSYRPVLAMQERLVEQRKAGLAPDTLLLVEHDPVYTLGRNAKDEHVIARPEQLAQAGIEVVRTGRGGDVTYHGPGQLVGYPILDLATLGRGVVGYVSGLEDALIRTLAAFGVHAATDSANRGVWVGRDKIAAIGVRITRGISMHGFALNVRADLADYGGIVPCGLHTRGVTSLHLLKPEVTMEGVKQELVRQFGAVFGYAAVWGGEAVGP